MTTAASQTSAAEHDKRDLTNHQGEIPSSMCNDLRVRRVTASAQQPSVTGATTLLQLCLCKRAQESQDCAVSFQVSLLGRIEQEFVSAARNTCSMRLLASGSLLLLVKDATAASSGVVLLVVQAAERPAPEHQDDAAADRAQGASVSTGPAARGGMSRCGNIKRQLT